jgi:hypothetical protein
MLGVGEASFISLALPFIDDNAPAAKVCFFPFQASPAFRFGECHSLLLCHAHYQA